MSEKIDLWVVTDHLDVIPLVIVKRRRRGSRVLYETKIHPNYAADEVELGQHRIYFSRIWASDVPKSTTIHRSERKAYERRLKIMEDQMTLLDKQTQRLRVKIADTKELVREMRK